MKIEVGSFLEPEDIKGATKDKPATATIEDVEFTKAEDLPFESEEGRYTIHLKLSSGKEKGWGANKTSMRAIMKEYGDESDDWKGKKVKLYLLDQNVRGEMKKVIYGEV